MIAQDQVQVNLKGLFLAFVVMIVGAVEIIGAIPNGDPLWFLPVFTEKPTRITLNDKGCQVELFEGEKGFDSLYLAVNEALTQLDGYNDTHGMGPGMPEQYRAQDTVVEVYYGRPVTIHVPYRFGHPDTLFIPVTGYFADSRSVFGGHNGDYWSGALRLKTLQPIAAAAQGIACQ